MNDVANYVLSNGIAKALIHAGNWFMCEYTRKKSEKLFIIYLFKESLHPKLS